MVLFMSSATVCQFIIFGARSAEIRRDPPRPSQTSDTTANQRLLCPGMIDLEYAAFFGFFGGVLGAIVGTKGAHSLLQRTGRPSFIVFFLAFILFGSGLLMVGTGSMTLMETGLGGFRPVCGRTGKAAQYD